MQFAIRIATAESRMWALFCMRRLNGPVQLENHKLPWWGHPADITFVRTALNRYPPLFIIPRVQRSHRRIYTIDDYVNREKSIRVLYTCTLVAFPHNSIFINYAKLNAFKLHNARWCGVSIDLNRCFGAPSRCVYCYSPFPHSSSPPTRHLTPPRLVDQDNTGVYTRIPRVTDCYDRDNNFYSIIENSGFPFVFRSNCNVILCTTLSIHSVRPSVPRAAHNAWHVARARLRMRAGRDAPLRM